MRVLGLDYGSKTVGVAVSDPLGLTAQGVEIIRRKSENKMRQTLARIEELIREYQVEKIVLGLPKNMNNTLGDRAEKSLELKKTLERRTGLAVVMWDERLTTVSAESCSYGDWCASGKTQRLCRRDCSYFYFAELSGLYVSHRKAESSRRKRAGITKDRCNRTGEE